MPSRPSAKSEYLLHFAVAALFFVLTLVFTFPLVVNLTTKLLGIQGDNMYWLGHLGWYAKGYVRGYPAILNDTQVFYPLGMNLIYASAFSLDAFLAIPIISLGGYVLAYNLISILSLTLSAFTTYLFAYDVTGSRFASIFGGIVFGFGAFQMVHALGHWSIFGPFWLPLLALFLNRLLRAPTKWRAFFAGSLFVLTSLTNGYTGVVAVFLVMAFVGIWLLKQLPRSRRMDIRTFILSIKRGMPFALSFLLPLIALIPVLWNGWSNQYPWSMSEYEFWAADPFDYIVPTVIHPIFGTLVRVQYRYTWGNFVERSLYVGIVPLALALYSLIKRSPFSKEYGLIGVFFLVLSMGPTLHFAGVNTHLPLPYLLIERLPFLKAARVVARLGVGVLLMVALLASMGLKLWMYPHRKARSNLHKRQLLAIVLIAVTIFEIYPIAPYPLTDPNHFASPVYVWLSQQPGDYAILEIPITYSDQLAGYHVIISGKKTTSGFLNIAPESLANYLATLTFLQPDTYGHFCRPINIPLLVQLNIRYILIHRSVYVEAFGENGLLKALLILNNTAGVHYINQFGGTIVYEVTGSSQQAMIPSLYCSTPSNKTDIEKR